MRYKTIDNCLQNRLRKWTLEDLVAACSAALYEYEGITKGISKRTIQLDLQNMRSEKLGYNAPITVTDKKYYSYEEKGYSITNTPLTQQDLGTLNEVLEVLKQFKGFGYFDELNGMITRLEDKLVKHGNKGRSFIDFEKNELLKGLEYIDPLHKAIVNRKTLEITYQSFRVARAQEIIFFPYLLKEYRNRWFLLGGNNRGKGNMLLALDRISAIKERNDVPYSAPGFDVTTFFDDAIGVSKNTNQQPQLIILKIVKEHAPYIITKPMHRSQKILKEEEDGTIFSIEVIWNFELERELLGFGEQIKILAPRRLTGKITARMKEALKKYQPADRQTDALAKPLELQARTRK